VELPPSRFIGGNGRLERIFIGNSLSTTERAPPRPPATPVSSLAPYLAKSSGAISCGYISLDPPELIQPNAPLFVNISDCANEGAGEREKHNDESERRKKAKYR